MNLNDKIPIIFLRLEYAHLGIKSNQIFVKKFYFQLFLHVLFLSLATCNAQEIEAKVELNKDRINRTGIDHINDLPRQIEEYINNFKWTDMRVLEHERIQCTIQITLNEVSESLVFQASIVIQSNRPIYGTMQNTSVLVLVDNNWSFSYPPNRVFIHDEFQFDEIASLIDYYAYLILGFDADTFSPLGGSAYLNRANAIHDLANTSNAVGWSRATRQGRALLIQSLTTPNYEGLRNAMYTYHRTGLDLFSQNPEMARRNILNALKQIQENRKLVTETYPFDLFFNAKYRELTSVFMDATPDLKLQAYTLLTEIDPSHISKYDELR